MPQPNACTALKAFQPFNPDVQVTSMSGSFMEDYKPFISEGNVSLAGDNVNPRPVRILGDTGASAFTT